TRITSTYVETRIKPRSKRLWPRLATVRSGSCSTRATSPQEARPLTCSAAAICRSVASKAISSRCCIGTSHQGATVPGAIRARERGRCDTHRPPILEFVESALDDCEHVARGEHEVVLVAVLHLGAAELRVDDDVAHLD